MLYIEREKKITLNAFRYLAMDCKACLSVFCEMTRPFFSGKRNVLTRSGWLSVFIGINIQNKFDGPQIYRQSDKLEMFYLIWWSRNLPWWETKKKAWKNSRSNTDETTFGIANFAHRFKVWILFGDKPWILNTHSSCLLVFFSGSPFFLGIFMAESMPISYIYIYI